MKIPAISDTHTLHRKLSVESCDLLIHAGDITDEGELSTVHDFGSWLSEISCPKVVVPGNHDFCFQRDPNLLGHFGDNNIYTLVHKMVTINGLVIFGSPWTPYFYDWAFNGTDEEEGDHRGPNLNRLFGQIPDYTDILVTHGPSEGILSKNMRGEECGSKMLRKHLERIKPKVHIHGHIHESYGNQKIEWPCGKVTHVYNVSSLKRDYITTNPVTVIEI